jgi:hypothetical protein
VESFRLVSGLGNLNGRLAYNSDWLVLNAAASFAFLGLRSFHLVPGLLFIVAVLYFAEGLTGLQRAPGSLANWLKVLFLPLAFRTLVGEISSPGTDLPVILLTWALMALAAGYFETRSEPPGVPTGTLVLLGVLPAFGSLTGGARIVVRPGDRLYAAAGRRVVEIPAARVVDRGR